MQIRQTCCSNLLQDAETMSSPLHNTLQNIQAQEDKLIKSDVKDHSAQASPGARDQQSL